MIIANHEALCRYLLNHLESVEALGLLESKELLPALDEDSLLAFFESDASLGLYVRGGTYAENGDTQEEIVTLAFVIGCRNLSGAAASLGTGDDPGAWNIMETVRNAMMVLPVNGTNISRIRHVSWSPLMVQSDMAVVGLDTELTLVRVSPDPTDPAAYGTGYGGSDE